MKQTVTISNKHLQEIFYRHNLPETAETSVTNDLFDFDLILYVHSTIFQLCGTGLPGLNQY